MAAATNKKTVDTTAIARRCQREPSAVSRTSALAFAANALVTRFFRSAYAASKHRSQITFIKRGTPPDFLKADTLKTMTAPSPANDGYALGWGVNKHNNWWHMGSLPGETAVAVRTGDGYCWAALINTRNRTKKKFNLAADHLLWEIRFALEKANR